MTRDRSDRREQARAVLLAAIMVISVFGGTMAFAGSAAAAASGLSVGDGAPSAPDGSVNVSVQIDEAGNETSFILEDSNGATTDQIQVTDGGGDDLDGSENGEVTASIGLANAFNGGNPATGDVTVYASEGGTVTTNDAEETATFLVDGDAPVFGDETPEDGSVIGEAEPIVVPIEDANTSVDFVTVTVNNSAALQTFEINPETATADGVDFNNGELTVTPGEGSVPELRVDDLYTVDVTAEDEVGNSNQTEFEFEIDSSAPTIELNNFRDFTGISQVETNDENQTVEVSYDPGTDATLNDSTVELTLSAVNSDYEETFNSSYDGYSDNGDSDGDDAVLTVNPETDDDVPSFPDDTIEITASAENENGNEGEGPSVYDQFTVDTQSPNVTNIELSDDTLNSSDVDGETDVTVEFDDRIKRDTVDLTVSVDGNSEQRTLTSVTDGQTEVRVGIGSELRTLQDDHGPFENESAVVNVTAASDTATNSLGNPDADASNTTFAIDTDGPSVSLGELPNNGELSGYVNVSSFVASTSDVDETTVEIEVGGEASDSGINENALVDITPTADNLTTQSPTYPDGTHVLVVTVEDDAGNTAQTTAEFQINNNEPVTVNQTDTNYLPGVVTPVDVGTSDVDVSEVFNEDEDSLDYEVDDDLVSDDRVVLAENNRGQTVSISAESGGFERTVEVEFAPLVGAESVSDEDEISIGVEADDNDLTELNVTVRDTDNYFEDETETLTLEDFDEPEEVDGDYIYSTTVDDLRDGQYEVTIDDTEGANGDFDTSDTVSGIEVDAEDPSAETAYVVDGDQDGLDVRVEFNEPVTYSSSTTFDGDTESVSGTEGVNTVDGVLTVNLNDEVQTADAPLVNVTNVQEAFGDEDSSDTSTEVATANFDLTADGLNVISLPAEAGSVPLEGSALDTDEAGGEDGLIVYAYDEAGNDFDESFSPGAEENTLTELEGGEGYIVNVDEDITVEFNVQNVPSEELQELQSQQISEGYNLIGHYQEGQQSVDQALAYLDTEYDIERGYSGTQVSALEAGEGYWLFSNGAGTHAPVNYGGISSERPNVGSVQVTDTTGDGVLQQDEQVEVSATVQHDAVIDSVTADPDDAIVADEDPITLTDGNNDGEYTGTLTVDFGEQSPSGDATISVQATDVDGNVGFGSVSAETADDTQEPKSVTNRDTGVEYTNLTAALNEAEEFQTLELSSGNFSEDRDSLTISTNNLELVGQGEAGAPEGTTIVPELRITGDSVEVDSISFEEINPSGDVTVIGDGVTLDDVNAENTITIEGNQASVDDSNASSIEVTGSEVSVSNTNASTLNINGSNTNVQDSSADTVSVGSGGSGASLNNVEATSYDTDQAPDTVSVSNPSVRVTTVDELDTAVTGGTVNGLDVGVAEGDVTVRVANGTYDLSETDNADEAIDITVEGLTLESAEEDGATITQPGTNGNQAINVEANNVTVEGLTVEIGTEGNIPNGIFLSGDGSTAVDNNVEFGQSYGLSGVGGDGDDVTIEDNTVVNGPIAYTGSGTVNVVNNSIEGTPIAEAFFTGTSQDVTFTGNNLSDATITDAADVKFGATDPTVNGEDTPQGIVDTVVNNNTGVDTVEIGGTTLSEGDQLFALDLEERDGISSPNDGTVLGDAFGQDSGEFRVSGFTPGSNGDIQVAADFDEPVNASELDVTLEPAFREGDVTEVTGVAIVLTSDAADVDYTGTSATAYFVTDAGYVEIAQIEGDNNFINGATRPVENLVNDGEGVERAIEAVENQAGTTVELENLRVIATNQDGDDETVTGVTVNGTDIPISELEVTRADE